LTVGTTVIGAAIVVVTTLIGWRRHPARPVVTSEINGWMRAENLPDNVSLSIALPRLSRRISRNQTELWRTSGLFVLFASEILLQLTERPITAGTVVFAVALGAYISAALGWTIYYRLRWVPVLRRLLDQGQRRFTTTPDNQE
jgi:hypothetical protein